MGWEWGARARKTGVQFLLGRPRFLLRDSMSFWERILSTARLTTSLSSSSLSSSSAGGRGAAGMLGLPFSALGSPLSQPRPPHPLLGWPPGSTRPFPCWNSPKNLSLAVVARGMGMRVLYEGSFPSRLVKNWWGAGWRVRQAPDFA